jgi:hypothetical protein
VKVVSEANIFDAISMQENLAIKLKIGKNAENWKYSGTRVHHGAISMRLRSKGMTGHDAEITGHVRPEYPVTRPDPGKAA